MKGIPDDLNTESILKMLILILDQNEVTTQPTQPQQGKLLIIT